MLYNNRTKSLRGKYWQLPNRNWKAVNGAGKQTICKLQVEAQRFAEKEVVSEAALSPGTKVKISQGSGTLSGQTATVVDRKEIKTNGRGVPEIDGHYSPVDWNKEVALRLSNGKLETMFKNRVSAIH